MQGSGLALCRPLVEPMKTCGLPDLQARGAQAVSYRRL